MKIKIIGLFNLFLFVFLFQLNATIILPDILSDNMVIQQNSKIKLWGIAKTNTLISIKVSWLNKTLKCVSKKNGSWEIFINTLDASFIKQNIEISDGKKLKIQNILIGEVWLCSGQSNMEMTFKGYKNEPISEASDYINNASEESGIRMLNVQKTSTNLTSTYGKGKWKISNHQNLSSFSAIGYFFALRMQKELKVPIGIINSSYGGSSIEGWLNPSNVEKYSDFDYKTGVLDSMTWRRPYVMFDGMIKPYSNFTIKGFLWYQGESNVGRYSSYTQKLQDLVYLWRYNFNNVNLPFYVVEIAPFEYPELTEAAKLREAQFKGVNLLLNASFVCTNDLVLESESKSIHPSQKKEIGQRLANLALFNDYHFDSLQSFSPCIENSIFSKDSIILSFKNCYNGLLTNSNFEGFEVADSSRVFEKTNAFLGADKKTIIILNNDKNFVPVSVRYCFKNFQIGNVKNSANLPLIPFRTDNWEN